MTPSGRLTALAILGLLLCSANPSRADAPPAPPALPLQQAGDHFARGVRLYEEQDFRAALIEFERAHALVPRFEVLYNVAQCRYQLKDYAAALDAFERYLADGADQVADDERVRVEASIEELRGRVAQVRVETNVSGAEVSLDDVPVGTTPLPAPVRVSEGRRKLDANKPGFEHVSRVVDVAGRDAIAVKLVLTPVVTPVVARPPVTPPRGGWSIAPALVAFGVGAVGVGVGAAFGVAAVGSKNDLDRACPGRACPSSAQGQIDTLQRYAVISTVGFSVGAAGALTGAAWLLFAPGRGGAESPRDSGRLHPVLAPGFVGAAGAF